MWRGGLITAALFTLGKTAIGYYLGQASVGSAYGAAGSLVVLLVWVYYSALIMFFGAEFTHAWATHQGAVSRIVKIFDLALSTGGYASTIARISSCLLLHLRPYSASIGTTKFEGAGNELETTAGIYHWNRRSGTVVAQ
jgi:hypothetical protein